MKTCTHFCANFRHNSLTFIGVNKSGRETWNTDFMSSTLFLLNLMTLETTAQNRPCDMNSN
jgi:hypothetical protein